MTTLRVLCAFAAGPPRLSTADRPVGLANVSGGPYRSVRPLALGVDIRPPVPSLEGVSLAAAPP